MSAAQTLLTPSRANDAGLEKLWGHILGSHNAPPWLLEQRQQALDVYRSTPLPSRVSHLWRYSDPGMFLVDDGDLLPVAAPGVPREVPAALKEELERELLAGGAYLCNSVVMKTALDSKLADAGVVIMDLHEAVVKLPDLVQAHLGTLVGPQSGKFEAFTNAAWSGGILIYVPKGVILAKPVHILATLHGAFADHANSVAAIAQRLLVIVEEDAELTLIDEGGDGTDGTGARVYTITEIVAGAGARVKYVPIQHWNHKTIAFTTVRARLDRDAQFETVMTTLGGQTSKTDCGAVMAGRGAESNMFGLAIGAGRQQYDHHTVQDHQSGTTRSDLHFKVALRGRASSAYTGLIRIEDKAPYCEAYQENRNLILSPGAKAESIPELEILNNEVRCTHGATVGKVDPQEVFYLGSRGIEPSEAVRLIVTGFVGPILDRIPDAVRDRVHGLVLSHLGDM